MRDRGPTDTAPVVISFPPEIHASFARVVFDPLYAAITSGTPVVIADLSATVTCDLTSVYGLIRVRDWASARQVRFRLVIPPGSAVRQLLELLGVDHQLAIYLSLEEARRPASAPPQPLPPYPPWPVLLSADESV